MKIISSLCTSIMLLCVMLTGGCEHTDDQRIPNVGVSINLSDAGLWSRYGVSGFGIPQYFIKSLREPSGFSYLDRTMTGYGGVLLISGWDFRIDEVAPLAYDLSCPVERKPDIRVKVDPDTFDAVCPVCGSKYDVTMGAGAPISGPARSDHFSLRRYQCLPNGGGYLIVN
ncbi:MAG: hypothetical protein HDS62_04890 [Bacteroidales bacterium]|nr:hypothetical protein [Bacteroidales bacterium]MDE6238010.1 hypothetical protein [Muribaculaceae bacterium]MDE6835952.1 hypothetical protein [Muribaculaceae bacterium]MDE6866432.1 hypothetical protein [Muribaculaceae bacterium]